MKIYVWPDYVWCEDENLTEFLMWRSYDYMEIDVPDEVEDIDEYIIQLGI